MSATISCLSLHALLIFHSVLFFAGHTFTLVSLAEAIQASLVCVSMCTPFFYCSVWPISLKPLAGISARVLCISKTNVGTKNSMKPKRHLPMVWCALISVLHTFIRCYPRTAQLSLSISLTFIEDGGGLVGVNRLAVAPVRCPHR